MTNGAVIGAMMLLHEDEENQKRERRKRNMGEDQILITSEKDMETTGQSIARAVPGMRYTDGCIRREKPFFFNPGWMAIASLAAFTLLTGISVLYILMSDEWVPFLFPAFTPMGVTISLGIGLIAGLAGRYYPGEKALSISLEENTGNNGTRVLIQVYDENTGHRIFSKTEIQDIIGSIKKADKKAYVI